jgi:uncharacterized membrane protein
MDECEIQALVHKAAPCQSLIRIGIASSACQNGKTMQTPTPEEKMQSLKTLTTVVYALYAATFLSGITCLVAIIINYVKQDDVRGTWLESHFRWQIRTFWYGLLWTILGALTWMIVIGWIVLAVNGVWLIYRLVKGWLNLNDHKPMYSV